MNGGPEHSGCSLHRTFSRRPSLGNATEVERRRAEKLADLVTPPEVSDPDERRSRKPGYCAFFYNVKVLGKTLIIVVYVDAAAMAWDPASLDSPLRENVETRGRAALEASVGDLRYPKRIFVGGSGVMEEGVHEPRYFGIWLMRLGVGALFGFVWTRILVLLSVPEPDLGWLLALVPIYFKGWLKVMYPSRLRLSQH